MFCIQPYSFRIREYTVQKNPVFTVVLCSDSPCKHWARIEIRANDGVLWFAKRIAFGTHYCGINCSIISKKFDTLHNAALNLVVFILRMYLSLSLNVQHFLIINVSPITITFCYSFRNVLKLITAANSSSKKSQYGIKLTTSQASTWQSLRLCIRWRGRINKIQMFSARWEPIEMLEEQFGNKLTRCWSNQNCN